MPAVASTSKDGRTTLKDQKSPSSRTQQYSSPVKAALATIDGHNRDEWSTATYPDTHTEITDDQMIEKLHPAYGTPSSSSSQSQSQLKKQKYKVPSKKHKSKAPLLAKKQKNEASSPPEVQKDEAPSPHEMQKTEGSKNSTYCDYLNKLSELVRETSKVEYTIQFRPSDNKSHLGHATKTRCRPDIIAIRHYPGQEVESQDLHWSQLEATGEEDSGTSSQAKRHGQAAAYTSYHLQARPDLVSVVGIFVSTTFFTIFFSNACRVLRTGKILWGDSKARQILWAYMWRLYNPDVDPSIQIDLTEKEPRFRIKIEDGTLHDGFVIRRAGESIGRRTIVMENTQNSLVIKEQYIEDGRRFKEGPILKKIHKDGRFPGVVCLDSYETKIEDPITRSRIQCQYNPSGNGDTFTRFKTRLVMKDKGDRLIDEDTPRSFLMGIYDLLEISRMLFKKCKILHRDISPDNVLVSTKPIHYTEDSEKLHEDLDDMYFSAYLLNEVAGQGTISPGRLETRIILIDFDYSEDQDPDNPVDGRIRARTGTPIFMARMVRSDTYPYGFHRLPPMPSIRVPRYPKNRLKTFPANDLESFNIQPGVTRQANEFCHLLRYDAESVYWCILWWCIQALPADHRKGSPGELMDSAEWQNLTSQKDARSNYIRNFPIGCLHPSYSQLEGLLMEMGSHLEGDLSFVPEGKGNRGDPEYLHEAFQRIILIFLVANTSEGFMNLKKSPIPRVVVGSAMSRTGSRSTLQLSKFLSESRNSTVDQPAAINAFQSAEVEVSQRTRSKTSKPAQKRTLEEDSKDGSAKRGKRQR